jgi:tripartite-type tricarboxylate transporter receptor subunit TctC
MPYDIKRDFAPVTLVGITPNILVVHPSFPVKSVRELIVFAIAKPMELNYASGPVGSDNYMAAELFKTMTGANITRVPYQGAGPAAIALLGGHVPLMFPNLSVVAAHLKAGRLRALAVTSAQPSALLPGLPTVGQTVPGYDAVGMTGIFAPARTPEPIIKRLNQEIVRFLNTAEAKQRLINVGAEAVGNSPEQFMATVESDIAKTSKLVKHAGISAE